MNEKEELLVGRIMNDVLGMGLSKYNTLFLSQLALRRYKVETKKKKSETLDESARKVMSRMPELCRKTKGLRHKQIIETSSSKSLSKLEEELCESLTIDEDLLRGDIITNVIDFLLKEDDD